MLTDTYKSYNGQVDQVSPILNDLPALPLFVNEGKEQVFLENHNAWSLCTPRWWDPPLRLAIASELCIPWEADGVI